MRTHTANGLSYFTFESFPNGAVAHAIFARNGGVSPQPWASLNLSTSTGDTPEHTRENRRRAFDALGLPFDSMADVWQVHGTETIRADEPRGDGPQIKADGLITDRPGLTLFQRFADCVPILLYDPKHRALGIAHAGWRGTVNHAAAACVKALAESYGTRPADLIAGIGPSIGPDHYEVGPEVVAEVRRAFPKADQLLTPPQRAAVRVTNHSGTCFDLWAANALTLHELGVEQIEIAGLCTACHTDDFFSHRAERGATGRFGAVIALR
ncbi:MAG TPA: peptidoglycan editing factor PgeF [Anaerolineales bacterium]|nr:peptidoglycan editing factor PgeF [Anaerolineales bacterium]